MGLAVCFSPGWKIREPVVCTAFSYNSAVHQTFHSWPAPAYAVSPFLGGGRLGQPSLCTTNVRSLTWHPTFRRYKEAFHEHRSKRSISTSSYCHDRLSSCCWCCSVVVVPPSFAPK